MRPILSYAFLIQWVIPSLILLSWAELQEVTTYFLYPPYKNYHFSFTNLLIPQSLVSFKEMIFSLKKKFYMLLPIRFPSWNGILGKRVLPGGRIELQIIQRDIYGAKARWRTQCSQTAIQRSEQRYRNDTWVNRQRETYQVGFECRAKPHLPVALENPLAPF